MSDKPVQPKGFYASLEGAQHGDKTLDELLAFAKAAGAEGVQPSNGHITNKDGSLKSAAEITASFEAAQMHFDGLSVHCPAWVHTTAWTGTPTIRRFIPAHLHTEPVKVIEDWAEDQMLRLMDLCAEMKVFVMPMFWGVAYGWEVNGSGYPWGPWDGPGYDLLAEGDERFVEMTAKIRQHAKSLEIFLAHEVHPNTAASTADDFLHLLDITHYDRCMSVNADPSHCWEGESWQVRFSMLNDYICGCHVKDHRVRDNFPLRCMAPDWKARAMQFTPLGDGSIDLVEYAEAMTTPDGYLDNYCQIMGVEKAPLICEAEAAHRELNDTAAAGIGYVKQKLCFPLATVSFEDKMGVQGDEGAES